MFEFDPQSIHMLHRQKTLEWHHGQYRPSQKGFLQLVEENHHCNFQLWHEEDKARRDDMGYEFVYRAKRSIDGWNQKRNDLIEKMDRWLVERLPGMPEGVPMNSETPGMIIDRLSILHLKMYHMKEEAGRESAGTEHRDRCRQRLRIIHRQHADLLEALEQLLADVSAGRRGFRVYYQFKMYNDPALNPQLYEKLPIGNMEEKGVGDK
ncbi:MAG: DUF4254 domain-containing protein [Deltaproteobacteria bacterium]|nr:DUF4254 domain-containing protein [Deltaproteobacteria bacterium]MBW2047866.1 DUF4254 domain-containing protein [Deltaproteobacteria bacterium]MBW2110770.1 DUF4254 domain-containing protein [Deltaproteobacteria bacterium]MBW2353701.1 DUF4254 domain-containing protein [Deltaproteobacteria bacterium]HDZ90856.1 DUF4254 domain-containing protein [Deltaproteobacteria bacterium]